MHLAMLIALVSAATVGMNTQEPASSARLGRCFTPVSATGVYFEVAADGPTERLLNMRVPGPKQTVKHSQPHQPAPSVWVYAPPIHAVPLRRASPLPTLLSPQRVAGAAPARTHHHGSVLVLPALGTPGDSLEVVADGEAGSTGCRVRLQHVVR